MDDGTPVWKLKNSWGKDWGMDGYVYIPRGEDSIAVESMPVSLLLSEKGKSGSPYYNEIIKSGWENLDWKCK